MREMSFSSIIILLIRPSEKCRRIWHSGVFSFVFQANSGSTHNHENGSSDISYRSSFNRDSNYFKKFGKNFCVAKNQFEIFVLISR